MNDTTQGFVLGITAALTGVLLYVMLTYGGAVLFGAVNEPAAPVAVQSESVELAADLPSPEVAQADAGF